MRAAASSSTVCLAWGNAPQFHQLHPNSSRAGPGKATALAAHDDAAAPDLGVLLVTQFHSQARRSGCEQFERRAIVEANMMPYLPVCCQAIGRDLP